jgi:hypothetical protein
MLKILIFNGLKLKKVIKLTIEFLQNEYKSHIKNNYWRHCG